MKKIRICKEKCLKKNFAAELIQKNKDCGCSQYQFLVGRTMLHQQVNPGTPTHEAECYIVEAEIIDDNQAQYYELTCIHGARYKQQTL